MTPAPGSPFFPPPAGPFGNSGRDVLDGPWGLSINLGLSRNFHIGERGVLQFRWEAFNATNHVNFQLPNDAVDANGGGAITAANDPRIMQFGARFQF